MANKFLRALAKVKLIELEGEEAAELERSAGEDQVDMAEIDRILAEEAEASGDVVLTKTAPTPARAPTPTAPTVPITPSPVSSSPAGAPGAASQIIQEGRAFDEIYLEAAVPPAAYPAEKLIKVLDGLKAMDPTTRRAAVLAMDAADDDWSVADAVLDAQRKVRSLNQAVQGMSSTLEQFAEHSRQEKERRDAYLAQATETIRNKILELEQTLQKEAAEVAQQKAEIDARLRSAQEACAREVSRLSQEVGRLQEIPQTFAVERTGGA